MSSKRNKTSVPPGIASPGIRGQPVTIQKLTTVESFTPEEELSFLVERGDWELALSSSAFQKRSQEGQTQIIQKSIDNRIDQLAKTLNYLVKRGPEHHAAAMGVIQRTQQLERLRDDILKQIYERFPRSITKKTGGKIDF